MSTPPVYGPFLHFPGLLHTASLQQPLCRYSLVRALWHLHALMPLHTVSKVGNHIEGGTWAVESSCLGSNPSRPLHGEVTSFVTLFSCLSNAIIHSFTSQGCYKDESVNICKVLVTQPPHCVSSTCFLYKNNWDAFSYVCTEIPPSSSVQALPPL